MKDENLPKSGSYVLNLDDMSGPGTHWVAVYEGEYFDSYGLPPPEVLKDKVMANSKRLQYARDSCGEWSVLYIFLRYAGLNPYTICYEIFPCI